MELRLRATSPTCQQAHAPENQQTRRGGFGDGGAATAGAEIVELEDVHVIVTRQGWLKRQRSYSDISTIRVRDGDDVRWAMLGNTREALILFSDRGRAYTMRIDSVPATSGYGEPVQAHFDFEDGERIVSAWVSDTRSMPTLVLPQAPPQSALPFGAEAPEPDPEPEKEETPSS